MEVDPKTFWEPCWKHTHADTLALWLWFSLLRELLASDSVTKTENLVGGVLCEGQAYVIWHRLLYGEWQKWLQEDFRDNILSFPMFWVQASFFFCQICPRNIFYVSSGETVVIFHMSLTRWLLLCFRPQCQLGSPLHSCSVVITKRCFSHLPALFTSSSVLETSGSFLVLRP